MAKATRVHSTPPKPASEFLTTVNRLQISLMMTRMKITSANNGKYGQWWGTAIDGDDKYQWFYTPRSRFAVRIEERPRMWSNIDNPPPSAKRAVLKAIRASRRGMMKCD
jgi:hypothetical protein